MAEIMGPDCASGEEIPLIPGFRAGAALSWDTIKAVGMPLDLYKGMMFIVGDARLDCAKYYRIQSKQKLGNQQKTVPVYINRSTLDQSWISKLTNGMETLNTAAPGLKLEEVKDSFAAHIVVGGNMKDGCWTQGNIILHEEVEISLDAYWPDSAKGGTAIHEILHALGFRHEHKRSDGETYLKYNLGLLDKRWKAQYQVSKFVTGLTRFDPHSIMLYPLCDELQRNPKGDTVWKTKVGDEQNQVLSELDKVGLNLLYRPVVHNGYNPSQSRSGTGLMYCFRHTVNIGTKPDYGKCGPKQGPNCAACRVLETDKSIDINNKGKWQGWSGLVYCGKKFRKADAYHDGYCGPNNGPQCDDCHQMLYPGNSGN